MDWTKEPPKPDELKGSDWASKPPSPEELAGHLSLEPKRSLFSGEGLARGAIDALPAAGMLAGGVVGAPLGLVGSVGGAGLGYAGGKELADTLKNRFLGDAPTSVNPVQQAKRVVGNTATGAAMEMGGQMLPAIGGMAKNAIDDVATAPLASEGERGLVANGLQKVHQLGANGNAILDKITPDSVGKFGRYAVGGKFQAGLDALEQAPRGIQSGAGAVSNGLDKASEFLMKSPRFQALAASSPKGFSALATKIGGGSVAGPGQPAMNDEQAKQDFLKGN